MWSAIGAVLAKMLEALLGALRARRQDNDRIATHETAAVAEAADETSDVIAAITAARAEAAGAAQSDDAGELAQRLRARKTGAGGGRPSDSGASDARRTQG